MRIPSAVQPPGVLDTGPDVLGGDRLPVEDHRDPQGEVLVALGPVHVGQGRDRKARERRAPGRGRRIGRREPDRAGARHIVLPRHRRPVHGFERQFQGVEGRRIAVVLEGDDDVPALERRGRVRREIGRLGQSGSESHRQPAEQGQKGKNGAGSGAGSADHDESSFLVSG